MVVSSIDCNAEEAVPSTLVLLLLMVFNLPLTLSIKVLLSVDPLALNHMRSGLKPMVTTLFNDPVPAKVVALTNLSGRAITLDGRRLVSFSG